MRSKWIVFPAIVLAGLGWFAYLWLGSASGKSSPPENWTASYEEAVKLSKQTGKPILADFTGSDWCVWCSRLRSEVFDKQEFKDWADKRVILLEVDFPRNIPQDEQTKKTNRELAEKYGVGTFPTIVYLKSDGTSLGKMGYQTGGPGPWIKQADSLLTSGT